MGFVTSAYSSYSGCRQYREDIARAQREVGPGAPEVEKLRAFFNHPGFIEATVERVRDALQAIPAELGEMCRSFTSRTAFQFPWRTRSDYVKQLEEVRRLVSEAIGHKNDVLVYQSRSGAPGQPWLEPDILDYLRQVKARESGIGCGAGADQLYLGSHGSAVRPGYRSAAALRFAGFAHERAKTVGMHPKFIGMIRELILERMNPRSERRALGLLGPRPDICAEDCCPGPGATRSATHELDGARNLGLFVVCRFRLALDQMHGVENCLDD